MKFDMQNAMVFAHRTNIGQYRGLLKTHLTVKGREFLERLLEEEETALLETVQRTSLVYCNSNGQRSL